MPMQSSMGWECSRCTYRHHAPGTRCVMCNELRVNKEKMRDFILGKEIPEAVKKNSSSVQGVAPKSVAAASPSAAAGTVKRTLSRQKMSNVFASSSPSVACAPLRRSATDPSPSTAKRPTPNKSLSQQFISDSFRSASPASTAAGAIKKPPTPPMKASTAPVFNPYARGSRPTARSQPLSNAAQQQRPSGVPPKPPPGVSRADDSLATSSLQLRMAFVAADLPGAKLPILGNVVQSRTFSAASTAGQQRPSTEAVPRLLPSNNVPVPPSLPQRAQHHTTIASAHPPTSFRPAPAAVNNGLPLEAMPPPAVAQSANCKPKEAPLNTEPASICHMAAARPQNVHRIASTNAASNTAMYAANNPFTVAAAAAESKKRAVLCRQVYEPGPVPLEMSAAKTWIYPSADDYPKRQYQYDIAKTAVLHGNTLVSLPTGLGKTLIAAVVMYNYYRWFPTGKVIFMAPTLPLVRQQVQACYEIMGIPATDTALLTGKMQASQRTIVWSQKRVFFCTPQTVQKDLENGRFDPSQVVCVVLDEAHKATGEYAYCKVVAQLEEAGAKFRVLGLSATPGTNLKAIQKVVDALRISCIEARSDSDPDVSQYVHNRETEVVVVPQVTASKLVERAIDEIIHPVLDRLRSSGATPQRFPGNATVTAWCVQRAKQEYQKRPDYQGSMLGYFTVGHFFVQLRADLHRHGIGVVRNKLVQLKNSSQRGYMSTVVRGNQFQVLWDQVTSSSWDPNAEGGSAQDRLLNNPKLSKLLEILTEHFERSRACETSSRAIVFSQFRDSVQEIESILQTSKPLIRGRHFVGQGKGSKAESGQKLKGMNQAEQQEAIRQFKEGFYNVLVCTCIGEEGLDIGEVDLIVNFDCLRSPIRMIQRVGRTGRKRDGRVVCLAAEGSEERTLKQSKVDERKLFHALKNPRSFKVIPTAPMFPEQPVVCERNMGISQNFHMSQVDGVAKKKKGSSICGPEMKQVGRGRWRLTDNEERRRIEVLGKLKDIQIEGRVESAALPNELCRRLLFARTISISRPHAFVGRTSQILQQFEESHAKNQESASSKNSGARTAARNCESALDALFPLTISDRKAKEDTIISPEFFNLNLSTTTTAIETRADPEAIPSTALRAREAEGNLNAGHSGQRSDEREGGNDAMISKEASHFAVATRYPVEEQQDQDQAQSMLLTLPVRVNPYAARPKEDNAVSRAFGAGIPATLRQVPPEIQAANRDGNAPHSQKEDYVKEASVIAAGGETFAVNARCDVSAGPIVAGTQQDASLAHSETSANLEHHHLGVRLNNLQYTSKSNNAEGPKMQISEKQQDGPHNKSKIPDSERLRTNDFQLPCPNDNGSNDGENQGGAALEADGKEDVFCLPSQSSDEEETSHQLNAQEDSFRLPTPGSSSSEEESDNEEGANSSPTETGLPEGEKEMKALDISQGDMKPSGQVRFSLDNLTAGPLDVEDTPDSLLPRRKNVTKRTKILAIEDTPDSKAAPSPAAQSFLVGKSLSSDGLCNTQDERGEGPDSCCAICFAKSISEENPIIFCDGTGDGTSCPLAVHVSCYNATVNLHDDSDWRCDLCEFRRCGGQINLVQCCACLRSDGVLKRKSPDEWRHLRCLKRIRRKNHDDSAALRSDLSGELRRPLANLSPNDESQDDAAIRKKRRKLFFQKFIDDEAEAEDGMEDEDDDDILAIEEEEEEIANSFINDSSQLGFTQDELDRADPHDAEDDATHRMLDNERERMRQFKTPMLNRRMQKRNENDEWSPTPGSAPDSLKGLGNMHFIRSVLEHHRQGGDAEDIEKMYQKLENEAGLDDENGE